MTKMDCEKLLKSKGFVRGNKGIWYRPGVYELRHGEYASPNYYVRHRSRGEFGIKVEYFYYPGTFNAPEDHFLTGEEIWYL